MSKAFQCNNCRECYPGSPTIENYQGDKDLCANCVRHLTALGVIDPLAIRPSAYKHSVIEEALENQKKYVKGE